MITGIIRTEQCIPDSKEVFWEIDNLGRRLEEDGILLSDTFSFGSQKWRVLLSPVDLVGSQYIDVSLSRITVSDKTSLHPLIWWHVGILDRKETFQYDRSGFVRMEAISKEWMTVDDWPGPEWNYISMEKDLYMPDDRFTLAIQLRLESDYISDKIQGMTNTTWSNLQEEENIKYPKEVTWTILDIQRVVEESDSVLSDGFSFGNQQWNLLLQRVDSMDGSYITVSLSRIDKSSNLPNISPVWWHVGIVDTDGEFHYDKSGWTSLGTSCNDWTTVENWIGPEWINMSQKKDLLMPGDRLTVSAVVCCHDPLFATCIPKDQEDLTSMDSKPIDSCTVFDDAVLDLTSMDSKPIGSCAVFDDVVVLNVNGRIFHTCRSILEIFSPVIDTMLYTNETDGQNEVLHLPDCDPDAFEIFLSFAYSGDLTELTDDTIGKVYYIADNYDVEALKAECVRHLLTTLNSDS